MRIVKGPDFPTGGLIMGDDGIKDAFRTGRGTVRVRARHEIEAGKRGGQAIVLTEVPFQTSVDAIAGKLAELVESGKIDGVRDIRNESGQGKTRLVIELRADTNPQIVLNNLFKHTAAQTHVPGQHGGARRRRAAHAQPPGVPAALARPPGRGRHPPHAVPPRPRRGAAAHRRGAGEGARHDRRDREGDPRVEGPSARRATRSWGSGSSSPRSRPTTSST